jgi:ABC-type branched-subunit amino acid transport system ATPase component
LYRRLTQRWRKDPVLDAAMSQRQAGEVTLPAFLRPEQHVDGAILEVEGISRSFGGIHAVRAASFRVRDRTLHALIGPNGAGKTTAFNLISGMFRPDSGAITLAGRAVAGLPPERITAAGVGRSFQITNLFPSLTVQENVRLAIQARDRRRFWFWIDAQRMADVDEKTGEVLRAMGLAGIEGAQAGALSYGGQRLLDMSLALATRPRILLLDEPLAGLAAGERERVGTLIKDISRELPVLLVEHDIDRVFALADSVTVMNDGEVLVDGGVAEARDSPRVQEVYIGSGTHALAGRELAGAALETVLLDISKVDAFYGKSHVLRDVAFDVRDREIVALLGRNGAGKSTLLKAVIGIVPPACGSVKLAGEELARRPSAHIARRGVAYVPQGRGLFAGMSVAHNLELGRLKRRTGAGISWDEERILAAFPKLKQRWRSPADYLSGGEQQMLAVARALAGDTRLLLLDEPFEGLAPSVIEELFESFHRLRGEVSIVIVDHHLDLVLALSDRTVALERGQVTHIGPSRALAADRELRKRVLWV